MKCVYTQVSDRAAQLFVFVPKSFLIGWNYACSVSCFVCCGTVT
jgi:hypothetical protein